MYELDPSAVWVRPVSAEDLRAAARAVRPSVSAGEAAAFDEFTAKYKCVAGGGATAAEAAAEAAAAAGAPPLLAVPEATEEGTLLAAAAAAAAAAGDGVGWVGGVAVGRGSPCPQKACSHRLGAF